MRRGELRRYIRPGSPDVPRTALILSSDSINTSTRSWMLGMELRQRDPGDILAIPVPGHGWAYVRDLTRLYRAWTGDKLGEVDQLTMGRLASTVQAALDL